MLWFFDCRISPQDCAHGMVASYLTHHKKAIRQGRSRKYILDDLAHKVTQSHFCLIPLMGSKPLSPTLTQEPTLEEKVVKDIHTYLKPTYFKAWT